MKRTLFRTLCAVLVVLMLSCLFAGCVSHGPATGDQTTSSAKVGSYYELFSLVKSNSSSGFGGYGYLRGERDLVNEVALDSSAPSAVDDSYGAAKNQSSGSGPDYTGTNLQHNGVDEADIVKTDGRYIYSLNTSSGFLTVSAVTGEGIGKSVKMSIFSFYFSDFYRQTYYYGAYGATVKSYPYEKWADADAVIDKDELIKGIDGVVPVEIYLAGDRLVLIGREETYKFNQKWYDSYKNEMRESAKDYYDRLDPSARGSFDEYLDHFISDVDRDGDGVPDYGFSDLRRFCSVQDSRVCAFVFDVSDPFSPVFVGKSGTDGYYVSSRLTGGKLYLVTSQYFYSPSEDDVSTYIPKMYKNDVSEVIAPSDIVVKDGCGSFRYVTVASIDPASGALRDVVSILGGGDGVYSAETDMFVYGWSYNQNRDFAGLYRTWGSFTDVTRIDLTGDQLRVAAETTIEGSPVNQFSFDWYNGYLRVVAKRNSGTYTVVDGIVDGVGLSSEEVREERYIDDTALYVLDGDLKQVGILEDCGRGETLRSVRFDGDVGYFVTFRNTDPLFAVDLSDPASPKLLSALKIPGFSTYMHPFGDGLMFGFGNDADIESGSTRGIKLSMFDVSDKTDVTECAKYIFKDVDYSSASYNHKAILVSAEKNLIGFFGGDGNYYLFGYDPENGFFEKAKIEVSDENYWYDDARGIYIDGLFYVVSSSAVTVMDLENSEVVFKLDFGTVSSSLLFKDGAVETLSE